MLYNLLWAVFNNKLSIIVTTKPAKLYANRDRGQVIKYEFSS